MDFRCKNILLACVFLLASSIGLAQQGRWIQTVQRGDIAYFLSDSPAEIARYDLLSRTFLPAISLSLAPTAFTVDDEGIYVAYNDLLVRWNLNGTGQSLLVALDGSIRSLATFGNNLYSDDAVSPFINRSDKTFGGIVETAFFFDAMAGMSVSPASPKIFGRSRDLSPPDILQITLNVDGSFIDQTDSPYDGTYPDATRTWITPDQTRVVDDSGTVYSTTDLSFVGTLNGAFDHIAFAGGEVLVLRPNTIARYADDLQPIGNVATVNALHSIYANNGEVVGFYNDLFGNLAIEVVVLPIINPPGFVNPIGLDYTPDAAIAAVDGTILLLSIDNDSIFRWSPAQQEYIQSIPLVDTPSYMAYSRIFDRVYVGYDDGSITQIDLATGLETGFASVDRAVLGLAVADPFVFVVDSDGPDETHYSFDDTGQLISSAGQNDQSLEYIWNAANARMYFFDDESSPNHLLWEDIDTFGVFGATLETPHDNHDDIRAPLRVAENGRLVVLGSGLVFDALSLEPVGALLNTLSDAQWQPDGSIASITGGSSLFRLQEWDSNFLFQRSIDLPSSFARLVAVNADLYIIWEIDGIPQFLMWNFGTGDLDGDGVADVDDAFPLDPAEWDDTDGDGVGNNADDDDDNDGVPDVDDAFPLDPTESVDTDGDGVGDNSDAFPLDPNEAFDTDGDGIGDNADPDDDNDGVLDGDDAFPLDPNESVDTDGDGIGNNADPDDDNDGVLDDDDAFPLDPAESVDTDGDGIGNNADPDDDNDGVLDDDDAFPLDPAESVDTDGDGIGNNADPDDDNDGVLDDDDAFPLDPEESVDTDLDGIGDNADPDDDNDGVLDDDDAFPLDPTESVDTDGDGIGNNADPDDDNDGIPDDEDAFPLDPDENADFDGDGIGNASDPDDDNDGVLDEDDAFPFDASEWSDLDGDGVGDNSDAFPMDPNESVDTDGDGVGDNSDAFPTDPNESVDTDGDGVGDNSDAFPTDPNESVDTDGDGVGDNSDAFPTDPNESVDTDGDGVGDNSDAFPTDPNESADTDGDGIGNNADTDDDNDEMPDTFEVQYGLRPLDPTDADEDPDNDGATNLEEYIAGTNPILAPASQDLLKDSGGGGSMGTDLALLLLLAGLFRMRREYVFVDFERSE